MKVYAFVGPSGTGKSYRAQMVANENNIHYIIDDGLFINDNEIIAGESAKKAPTKIETVKKALFLQQAQKDEIRKAIEKYKPESILILGTSDGMVNKIAANIGLPPIEKIIYIDEIATPEEIQEARRSRVTEGKHVIPVPTFEIKKDFSGFILDPLQIFKFKGENNKPYISEKSIIRPTFSYLGNFTISDTVFRQIIEYIAYKDKNIHKIIRTRIDNQPEGPYVYIELSVEYGENVRTIVDNFKNKVIKELEKLTTMRVRTIKIIIKEIYVNKEENK
ncbi:MAG: ATP-binding protein [Clostridium sp.]|nr:ATP-binding protein [Clostridium sp.]MBS5863648.1 ATP-binding protein [Clostridium sp.]